MNFTAYKLLITDSYLFDSNISVNVALNFEPFYFFIDDVSVNVNSQFSIWHWPNITLSTNIVLDSNLEITNTHTFVSIVDVLTVFLGYSIRKYHFTANLGQSFGQVVKEDIELSEVTEFMSDFYSIKYLHRQNPHITRRDVVDFFVSLSNLLRNCHNYGINEVFLGSLRFRKSQSNNYWVLVEW